LPLSGSGPALEVPLQAPAYTDTVIFPHRLPAHIANEFFEERNLQHISIFDLLPHVILRRRSRVN